MTALMHPRWRRRTATPLGRTLYRLRTSRKLRQISLGRSANISHAVISRLESGDRVSATRETVLGLADAMNLTEDERLELLSAAGYISDEAQEHLMLWAQLPPRHRRYLSNWITSIIEENAP